jgi:predicted dehydrogenase
MADGHPTCLLIGLGKQALKDHLPALIPSTTGIELVGVCDIDPEKERLLYEHIALYPDQKPVKFYVALDDALDELEPTLAIVATPYNTHLAIAYVLASRNIPFIKEKPFAVSLEQAYELAELMDQSKGTMRLCVPRHFHPLYVYGRKALGDIGRLRHFSATYQLGVDGYASGWRSQAETASGGGAVIDMGYHVIDLLVWYFGLPDEIYASCAPRVNPEADYAAEETILASVRYSNGCIGNLLFSLCEPYIKEEMRVHGSRGYYVLQPESLERFDEDNELVEVLTRRPAWQPTAVSDILMNMIENLDSRAIVNREIARSIEVMTLIDAMYRSVASGRPVGIAD